MRLPGPGLRKKSRDFTLADELWVVVYIFIVPIACIVAVVVIAMWVSKIF